MMPIGQERRWPLPASLFEYLVVAKDGLLYLARAGTLGFQRSSPPAVILGLFVPNHLNKELGDSIIETQARVTQKPFGGIEWNEVCRQLPAKISWDTLSKETPQQARPQSEMAQLLVGEMALTIAATSDVRLFACVVWPHELLQEFRDLQKKTDSESREPLVWKHGTHMVLQRAHIYLNDQDAYASVVVDADTSPLNPATYELLKAPGYDRFITYRRLVEALGVTQPHWSPLLQCASMLSELVLLAVQRGTGAAQILQKCHALWHRGAKGAIVQTGLVALPNNQALIKTLTAESSSWT